VGADHKQGHGRSALPVGADLTRPSPARMYDYYLGGAHNFAVDRDAADRVLATLPEVRTFAIENRAFLRRVVRYLVTEAGVTQFLDLGSGIPTAGNVHEIAQAINPECRVVYVDHDPIAVAHCERLLAAHPCAAAVRADLRHPDAVLSHPKAARLLDLARPLAVLLVSVLPFVPDSDDPAGIVAAYRAACAPGSYLALSHCLSAEYWTGGVQRAIEVYAETTHPVWLRVPDEVATLFRGYRMVEPGLVFTAAWRPDLPVTEEDARSSRGMAGLGWLPPSDVDGDGAGRA